jgi:hypothetical protein
MRAILRPVLALAVGVAAFAADNDGLGGWADPQAPFTLAADRAALDALISVAPLDLWSDAQAAAWRRHVTAQAALIAADLDTPPFDRVLAHSRALLFHGWWGPDPLHTEHDIAIILDAGDAAPAMRTWLQQDLVPLHGDEHSVGPFAGRGDENLFAGWAGNVLALGGARRFEELPTSQPRGPGSSLAHVALDLGAVWPKAVALAEAEGASEALAGGLRGWNEHAPRVRVELGAAEGVAVGQTLIDGLPELPLRAVAPALLKRARPGQQVSLALAVAPQRLEALALAIAVLSDGALAEKPYPEARAAVERQAAAALGAPLPELSRVFAGDLLVQGGWSAGPLPQVAVTATLADRAAAKRLLEGAAARLGGTPADAPGADLAVSFPAPVGTVVAALAGDLLVVANDPGAAADALAAKDAAAVFDRGGCLLARVDLPSLARQWLPLLYAQAANLRVPLGSSPLSSIVTLAWQVNALTQANSDTENTLSQLRGLASQPWLARPLQRLWPELKPEEVPERAMAVHRDDGGHLRIVLRANDGFVVLGENDWNEVPAAVAKAALPGRLEGFTRIWGPEPAALAALTLPERAVLDQRALPPLPALLAHLRPWRLDVELSGGAMRVSERGLPLATIIAGTVASFGWAWGHDLDSELAAAQGERAQREVRARHVELIAALERVGTTIQALSQPIPGNPNARSEPDLPKPSALIGAGKLGLADFAPLCPSAPTTAEDVDHVGRWFTKPAGPLAVRWAIPLEGDWLAVLTWFGGVQVERDAALNLAGQPPEAEPPAAPAPGKAEF